MGRKISVAVGMAALALLWGTVESRAQDGGSTSKGRAVLPGDAGQHGGSSPDSEATFKPVGLPKLLRVATKPAPPFAIKATDGEWEGISIELWRKIAKQLGHDFEFRETDLQGMLQGVQDGTYDVGVAATTVTAEREAVLDFSHPFFTTGLGIALLADRGVSWWTLMQRMFSWSFLKSLGALLGLLLLVGLLVWLFERKKNAAQFGGAPSHGIGAAFWWSAVTMTTVGYGDKAPVTFGGRLIGLVWMFVSVITISGFTAAIASSLTVNQLDSSVQGPEDLPRVRVGSLSNTTSAEYLRRALVAFRPYETPLAGLQGLADGEIDAMVYDAPILQYFVNTEFRDQLTVLSQTFERQDYAIVFPAGSPLREEVNRLLLEYTDSAWWDQLLFRYLGR